MSCSILRQPLKVILHCLVLSDFNFVCIIYRGKGGQGGPIEILLAPGNYPEVLVQPRWWNVLMFMHMKGITLSNSWTTISLPHCVIINGLDCIQNAKTPLILNHILFQIILSMWMHVLVLSPVISFVRRKKKQVEFRKRKKTWNNFYFKSLELHSVKVIMGCRQWEERHGELISLAKREEPCIDPSVVFPLHHSASHTISSVTN